MGGNRRVAADESGDGVLGEVGAPKWKDGPNDDGGWTERGTEQPRRTPPGRLIDAKAVEGAATTDSPDNTDVVLRRRGDVLGAPPPPSLLRSFASSAGSDRVAPPKAAATAAAGAGPGTRSSARTFEEEGASVTVLRTGPGRC